MEPNKRQRYLIVNADDLGLSAGVNRGIIRTFEHGVLTSASLMVRQPAAAEAAEYARAQPRLSVGLHLDLAEWIYADGEWRIRYQVVSLEDRREIESEVIRQLATFRSLVGKNPSHVDSHQHVHRNEPVGSVLRQVASNLGVPLRSFSSHVRYCGDFYGQTGEGERYPQGISLEVLINMLHELPAGATELGCHPGEDDQLPSVYRLERRQEVAVLCDARVREAMDSLNIHLCSFNDLPRLA